MLDSPFSRVLLLVGLLAPIALQEAAVHTVPGPEASDLVARTRGAIVMSEPVGGIALVLLPSKGVRAAREPDAGALPVHSLSGPDALGRVAFVENDMLGEKHALKLRELASGSERVVFEARGDALWGAAAGKHLALDAQGTRVALVARAQGVQMRAPGAYLMEGELEVWSVESRERLLARPRVLDDALAWFPDGERLAYAALVHPNSVSDSDPWPVEPADPLFGIEASGWSGWERKPAVHVLDLRTGEARALEVGMRPILAPDGRTLIVRDLDLHWRILDLESKRARPFAAPGAIYPGAIAFTDTNTVLYWAWPTEGELIDFTKHNSPLVGKKQMRALKLVDLRDGRFQTAVPYVDPRHAVSFGPWAARGD